MLSRALKQDNKLEQNDDTTLGKMDFIATECAECHYAKNSNFIVVLSHIFYCYAESYNCYSEVAIVLLSHIFIVMLRVAFVLIY
jgi:hypothetical protein